MPRWTTSSGSEAATPLLPAPASIAGGRDVFLKREDVHELGAFKWRGATRALEAYRAGGASSVVTASTGNHGAATAWAARRLGMHAIVYVPRGASATKTARIREHGAELRELGADLDEAKDLARSAARDLALPFFEDGESEPQIAGYEAIGAEVLAQCPAPPAAVICPVGNGALLGGIGRALARATRHPRCIGVVAKEAPVMGLSHLAGRAVAYGGMATFADGLAVRVAIPSAVDLLRSVVHEILFVSERAMARAIGGMDACGIRVEGAAAAPLAALPQLDLAPGPVVLVITGRNIDDELHRRAVQDPESFPE
ncbi:MAG: PLP-dependent lyase/thiolase [Acidobacteriota bacterium]